MPLDDILDTFLRWLHQNQIQLCGPCKVKRAADNLKGVSVISTSLITHPQRVAVIPKTSLLSVRSCTISTQITWAPYGHHAALSLSLALYAEILRGPASRWHGYLQSLPPAVVPIARLWAHHAAFPDDQDARDAADWISRTEVHKELQSEDGTALLIDVDDYYTAQVVPVLTSVGFQPSISGFLHAYSLVCSRAFLVDAYHGLSMVPIADAFNHTHDNHVQLASEYDVCPTCGSLSECPHDREDPTQLSADEIIFNISPALDPADTVDMVTVRSVPGGAEIFNTYGANLSNAALLARYGFLLEGGETDVVTFGWPGSGLVISMRDLEGRISPSAYSSLQKIVNDSALAFVPSQSADGTTSSLCINSDGQISLGLFVWAVMDALTRQNTTESQDSADPDALDCMVLKIASTIVETETAEDISGEMETQAAEHSVLNAIAHIAGVICDLCRTRAAQTGITPYDGASVEVIGELMDVKPAPERTKTRLALQYLLGERAILEACAAGWEELRDSIVYLMTTSNVDEDEDEDDSDMEE
ncbi:hypothetical protein C8Q74DRAFT_1190256 [Fomes fomentarius]|nr:hypothetical protein C8Q74DRAFT_1190256 [Fomes fomentarius]